MTIITTEMLLQQLGKAICAEYAADVHNPRVGIEWLKSADAWNVYVLRRNLPNAAACEKVVHCCDKDFRLAVLFCAQNWLQLTETKIDSPRSVLYGMVGCTAR